MSFFTSKCLKRYTPVLHEWFVRNAADPSDWLQKRNNFVRSQAVWSILGFVVGLGDRHGENILLSTMTGSVVHVDFDCLFGKGMKLDTPEVVPFRLTQNCVSPLGVCGVEGGYRRCCELTMSVFRKERRTIMSILHAFIADPFVGFTMNSQRREMMSLEQRAKQSSVAVNEVDKKLRGMVNVAAQTHGGGVVDGKEELVVEDRKDKRGSLRGVGKFKGKVLSVEGQVDELIRAATCTKNLSEMYIGWMPFL
mmetsp:Transcript_20575/g.45634  ORF Transcript_20575/g.45634 Transcript_20575/m.45634 type:complete len:251 (+) Transcript_20575:2452-3204(+)